MSKSNGNTRRVVSAAPFVREARDGVSTLRELCALVAGFFTHVSDVLEQIRDEERRHHLALERHLLIHSDEPEPADELADA